MRRRWPVVTGPFTPDQDGQPATACRKRIVFCFHIGATFFRLVIVIAPIQDMRLPMMRLISLFLLSFLFSTPAAAFTEGTGYFTDLEFVSETDIPGQDGQMLSLCHVTNDFQIANFTILSTITSYGLSSDGCREQLDRIFSSEQLETAQSLNLVSARIPAVARNDLERNLRNYGIWAAMALGMIAIIIRRIKSLLRYDLRAPMRKKAADRLLKVMCYVGKCDGMVASNEIALIRTTASRLSRRRYQSADVIRITDKISMKLSAQDFIDFGRGLRDHEKDEMMRGAFFVAVASGRMMQSEHDFLTQLAHGIGMPAEDFRRVMNNALMDLDIFPPSL